MTDARDLSALDRFTDRVRAKLRANDHKGPWSKDTPSFLLGLLRDEVRELVSEVQAPTLEPARVLDECCDVAAFAMMLADVVGGLPAVAPPVGHASAEEVAALLADNARLRAELERVQKLVGVHVARDEIDALNKRWAARLQLVENRGALARAVLNGDQDALLKRGNGHAPPQEPAPAVSGAATDPSISPPDRSDSAALPERAAGAGVQPTGGG